MRLVEQAADAMVFGCRPQASSSSPLRWESRGGIPPQRFQCEDGLDNNGNGLADRFDPSCWENPTDPSTYLPFIDEGSVPPEKAGGP